MIKEASTDNRLLELMRGSKAQRNKALRTIYKNNKEKACSYILGNNMVGIFFFEFYLLCVTIIG